MQRRATGMIAVVVTSIKIKRWKHFKHVGRVQKQTSEDEGEKSGQAFSQNEKTKEEGA